jgi:predicted HTH domain antitoxin
LQLPDSLDAKEAQFLLAAKLYERGDLSLGQAAELGGYSKRQFMELLGNYDVSLFSYTGKDLEDEIRTAQNYHL